MLPSANTALAPRHYRFLKTIPSNNIARPILLGNSIFFVCFTKIQPALTLRIHLSHFIVKISALFETSCFKKGVKHRSLHQPPEQRGSNLGDCRNQPFGIYGIIGKFSSKKSPETLDAVGVQPTASIAF